ncbi:MAG: hypothetical protein ACJ749_14630 [Flavisolibacter sp.]
MAEQHNETTLFRNKTILVISPESWDHLFVSKHHYSMELARAGNLVCFLNPPVSSGRATPDVQPVDGFQNLFVITYKVFFRGMRFLPRFMMRAMERRFVGLIEKRINKKFDIVWNFENSRFYDLGFAGKNVLKLYHQVDHVQKFHPEIAAKTADIVLAVNTPILEELKPYNPLSFKIPHAYQGNLSSQAEAVLNNNYVYKKPVRLKAYYIGNLDFYVIDKALLEKLVAAFPNIDFILVGPYKTDGETYTRLHQYKHVTFSGTVPSHRIPDLLADADLLFFVHDPKLISSSHKMLEYLGSGKLIVSTFLKEYEQHRELLNMADSREDYIDCFKNALENIEALNSPGRMKMRIDFAMEHSYQRQIALIENLLVKNVPGAK